MQFSFSFLTLGVALASAAPPGFGRRDLPVPPSGFDWGNETIRGVNLGGWLVLEPWITPSIFDQYNVVDEYHLTQQLGADAVNVLAPHWGSWVTPDDINKISSYGFNMVRIPIGFWAYDNAGFPYIQGAAPYLDDAIEWARQAQPNPIKVFIDLHGVPYSQNGFDNSGERMDWPQWQNGDPGANRTLAVLNQIQSKYGDSSYDDVIMGIEIVNEPLTPELDMDQVKQYYLNSHAQQREYSQSRVVVMHDGFQNTNYWNGFLTPYSNPSAQNVAVDHHEYQVFTPELVALNTSGHLEKVCSQSYVYDGSDKWTFVGEWTGAMTDCAKWLNGYGIGSRYEGQVNGSWYVGSCADKSNISLWSEQMRQDTTSFIEAQMDSYEKYTRGWTWWNFKTEGADDWDAFALIEAGIFPQPLTNRTYDFTC